MDGDGGRADLRVPPASASSPVVASFCMVPCTCAGSVSSVCFSLRFSSSACCIRGVTLGKDLFAEATSVHTRMLKHCRRKKRSATAAPRDNGIKDLQHDLSNQIVCELLIAWRKTLTSRVQLWPEVHDSITWKFTLFLCFLLPDRL